MIKSNNSKLNFTKNYWVSWFSCRQLKITKCSIFLTQLGTQKVRLHHCYWQIYFLFTFTRSLFSVKITLLQLCVNQNGMFDWLPNEIFTIQNSTDDTYTYIKSNSAIVHDNPCFNLFILHNNSFDNQGSKINKNNIFLHFNILTYKNFFPTTHSVNLHLSIMALVLDFTHNWHKMCWYICLKSLRMNGNS